MKPGMTWQALIEFWLAIVAAISAQWLLEERAMTRKQAAAAVVCGVFCAYFGTWPIVDRYSLSPSYVPMVAGLLALTGRQIVAIAIKRIPEMLSAFIGAVAAHATHTANSTIDSWARGRVAKPEASQSVIPEPDPDGEPEEPPHA